MARLKFVEAAQTRHSIHAPELVEKLARLYGNRLDDMLATLAALTKALPAHLAAQTACRQPRNGGLSGRRGVAPSDEVKLEKLTKAKSPR